MKQCLAISLGNFSFLGNGIRVVFNFTLLAHIGSFLFPTTKVLTNWTEEDDVRQFVNFSYFILNLLSRRRILPS